MDEKVKKFLENAHKEEMEQRQNEKNKVLHNLCLYERIENKEKTEDTPYYDYSRSIYYGFKYCDVDDKEYNEILSYYNKKSRQKQNENKESPILSIFLTIFAWIGIISSIIGSIFCFDSGNVVIGCAVLFGGLLESLLVMAIGKIYESLVDLYSRLVDIHNKIDK